MQCVILAAGKGTRMGELTTVVPKPMLMLKGKPILDYKIRHLPKEITEIILVVGYNHEIVREYFGNNFAEKKITYVLQNELNGTGGALHAAGHVLEERFLILMGDDLYHADDLLKLLQFEMALLAYPLAQEKLFGVVKVDAHTDLLQVIEKSQAYKGDLANTGAYVLTKDFFNYPLVAVSSSEYGLPQTMATMTKDMPIRVVLASRWMPVTSPEDIRLAESRLDEFYPE